jgi:hypothetical protein
MIKSDEVLFEEFKAVLRIVGQGISATDYDRLNMDKPNRKTLVTRLGKSWNELKALADPISGDVRSKYIAIQNKTLAQQLEQEKNKTKIFLDNCMAEIQKVSFSPFAIPKPEQTKENLEFHALRSDAQVGERTDPASVQGLSNYNINIYKKRLAKWVEKILTFKEQDKASLGLNKLVINHLGDQVEGEQIYKGQAFYIDASLSQQLFISIEQEASALMTLAKVFPQIEVYCVVGNHGRPGNKGENHKETNFDFIFYICLKKWVEQQTNIKIFISESPSLVVQHGDFIFALNHGDSVKGWGGIPFYGLERTQRRLPDLYGLIINYGLYGHHHQPVNIADKIIVNGCLPGGSELSINKMGLNSLPSQKIFYFHPKNGINRETNLYLENPVKLKADKNRIFTAWK